MLNEPNRNNYIVPKNDLVNLLVSIPLVKEIAFTTGDLRFLNNFLQLKSVRKGDFLLKAGETESGFRFLLGGLLRFYYVHDGEEICTHFVEKDEIACSFGSYTSQQASVYNIEALESSTFLVVKKADMDKIMHRNERFWNFSNRLLNELYQQKEKRERDILNTDALERLQQFFDSTPQLFLKLSQINIASYLNIRPETLSHLKRKLVFRN